MEEKKKYSTIVINKKQNNAEEEKENFSCFSTFKNKPYDLINFLVKEKNFSLNSLHLAKFLDKYDVIKKARNEFFIPNIEDIKKYKKHFELFDIHKNEEEEEEEETNEIKEEKSIEGKTNNVEDEKYKKDDIAEEVKAQENEGKLILCNDKKECQTNSLTSRNSVYSSVIGSSHNSFSSLLFSSCEGYSNEKKNDDYNNSNVEKIKIGTNEHDDSNTGEKYNNYGYSTYYNSDDEENLRKQKAIYFCGHSLGLMPKNIQVILNEELQKWKHLGVLGHTCGKRPWVSIDENAKKVLSLLVGCKRSEVVPMNSLTVNLHLLLTSFYRPTKNKYKILIDFPCFGSDYYALKSQIELKGFGKAEDVIITKHNTNDFSNKEIISKLQNDGDSICLVFISAVQYLSGEAFDIQTITKIAHQYNSYVILDLAHAIGNVELRLHDWQVDAAAWCSYKYLNAGPGTMGGIFIHKKHGYDLSIPRLAGWWGTEITDRFEMKSFGDINFIRGVDGFRISNPSVFQVAVLLPALNIFELYGFQNILQKSKLLTSYLYVLLQHTLQDEISFLTPYDINRRGCQLSISFKKLENEKSLLNSLCLALENAGIIVDTREPATIRIAPTPLYNSFEDVFNFVTHLNRCYTEVVSFPN